MQFANGAPDSLLGLSIFFDFMVQVRNIQSIESFQY